MISYANHTLLEGVNKHITHLEDLFIEQGHSGGVYALKIIEDVVDSFENLSSSSGLQSLTIKYDGSPAIVCGVHPKTNQYFVASKSIFNKTPKINYTFDDIDRNHTTSLNPILKTVLRNITKTDFDGNIYQGDLMYSPSILRKTKIDGIPHWSFTPNTLTYAVPVDSKLGKRISKSKIGIAFHTKYTGNSIESLSASYGFDATKEIRPQKELLVINANLPSVNNIAFSDKETKDIKRNITQLGNGLKKTKGFTNALYKDKLFLPIFKQYINNEVRNNSTSLDTHRLRVFVEKKFESKPSKQSQLKKADIQKFIRINEADLETIFLIHQIFYETKMILANKLNQIGSMKTFIKKNGEFVVTNPEGYVAVDTKGNVIKLVDRLTFSRINFNGNK